MRPLSSNLQLFVALTIVASTAIAGALTTNPILRIASIGTLIVIPAFLYRSAHPLWVAVGIGTGAGTVLSYWVARQLGFQDINAFFLATFVTGVFAGAFSSRQHTSLLWRFARAILCGLVFMLSAYATVVTLYLLRLFFALYLVVAFPIAATIGGTVIGLGTWWLDLFRSSPGRPAVTTEP